MQPFPMPSGSNAGLHNAQHAPGANSYTTTADRRLCGSSSAHVRHVESSLDATFALLNDVRAQSFALQLKLRNSLPMRWSDNAFVMQRLPLRTATDASSKTTTAAPWKPRMRAVDEYLHAPDTQREHDDGDFMTSDVYDPLLSELGNNNADWNRQRYRRRVEWDVARRIARIDRELQKLSPEQRFWNKNRRSMQQQEQQKQRLRQQQEQDQLRVSPMARTRATTTEESTEKSRNVSAETSLQPLEPKRVVKDTQKPSHRLVSPASKRQSDSSTTSLESKLKPREEKETYSSRDLQKAAAPRTKHRDGGDKSSRVPEVQETLKTLRSAAEPTKVVTAARSSSIGSHSSQSVAIVEAGESVPVMLDASRDTESKAAANADPVHGLSEDVPAPAIKEPPCARVDLSLFDPLNDDSLNDAEASKENAQLDGGHSTRRPRQSDNSKSAAVTSTLGRRQALSEYRSGPCLALYGPPPVVSTTGDSRHQRRRQLNSDVLRRLFSDLDTDRDGHLNRIETCMALHRLQISVPASMIASFFRRVHDEDTHDNKQPTKRGNVDSRMRYEPLREVINYKQFVAFVTAANEHQSSTKQQSHAIVRPSREPSAAATRANEAPAVAPTTPPIKSMIPFTTEPVTTQYVLDETPEVERIEQRVLADLPDFVLSKLLSEENDQQLARNARLSLDVVRKSLGKWLPRDSIGEKLVQQIAQELLREHLEREAVLRKPHGGNGNGDGDDDRSGLRRAAAYFEARPLAPADEDDTLTNDEEAVDSGGLNTWFHALSEEQVSGLVHEILKEKKTLPARAMDAFNEVSDDDISSPTNEAIPRTEKPNDIVESTTLVLEDKETDVIDFLSTHIGMVAEKATQAVEEEADTSCLDASTRAQDLILKPRVETLQEIVQHGPTDEAPRTSARDQITTRTHLTDAILRPSGQQDRVDAKFQVPAMRLSNLTILRRLRQERKRAVASKAAIPFGAKPLETDASKLVRASTPSERSQAPARNAVSDDDQSSSSLDVEDTAEEEETLLPHTLMIEKKLLVDLDGVKPFERSDSVSSSSRSLVDSSVEGSSSSRLFAELILPKRQQRRKCRTSKHDRSASSSEDRSSVDSDDLSEGELDKNRMSLDLSDGEIYGAARNRVVRQKNRRVFTGTGTSDESFSDSRSSIESGELLPILTHTLTLFIADIDKTAH
ncbi:hypothetical protein FI667_g7012, partial [Globisporangium splendens]